MYTRILRTKDSIAYNVSLEITDVEDFYKYYSEFEALGYLLGHNLREYTGYCKIMIDIGNYKILSPDRLKKQLIPQIHIIVYGTKIQFVEKKIDEMLEKGFVPNKYDKIYFSGNPFDIDNIRTFEMICYQREQYTFDGKEVSKINFNE